MPVVKVQKKGQVTLPVRLRAKAGNFTRIAVASGLLGLYALGAGVAPAYAQRQVKSVSNSAVKYIPCTAQPKNTEEISEGELLALLGIMAAGSSSKPEAQELGTILSTVGVMRHQKEVAREGRSNINTNQENEQNEQSVSEYVPAPECVWANPGDPNDLTVKKSIGVAFASEGWADFNHNGRAEPNEYVVRNRFYGNEPINLVIYAPEGQGIKDGDIKLEVYNPKGKRVFRKYIHDGGGWSLKPGNSKFYRLDLANNNGGEYGTYSIVWQNEGAIEKTTFEFLPSLER